MRNYEDDYEKEYLEINGSKLYIDLDEVINVIKIDLDEFYETEEDIDNSNEQTETGSEENPIIETKTDLPPGGISIDVTKWELINKMVDCIIMRDLGEQDSALGKRNMDKLPLSFKMAYNTLLKYNILKTINE